MLGLFMGAFLGRCQWQGEPKHGALLRLAIYPNLSPMDFYNLLANVESQPQVKRLSAVEPPAVAVKNSMLLVQ